MTPITPPTSDIVADSIRNCSRMSLRRAPSALRTPISRVRSVTRTSMMFMITMPPITSEMPAIDATTAPKLFRILPSRFWKVALVSIVKVVRRVRRQVTPQRA